MTNYLHLKYTRYFYITWHEIENLTLKAAVGNCMIYLLENAWFNDISNEQIKIKWQMYIMISKSCES